MLVFIIPLKSAGASKDWSRTCRLFERCIRSVCHQTSDAFKAIVVCNEIPDVKFFHKNLVYKIVDFQPPEKVKNPVVRGDTDKGRRILKGVFSARSYSPSHIMFVDADDCVSNRLADFVESNPEHDGWYIKSGFKYLDGDKYIYTKPTGFYRMCGTSNIVKFSRIDLPKTPEYNRGYGYYRFYLNHRKIREYMIEKGCPLKALPFAGAVYVLSSSENLSGNGKNLSFNFILRRRLNDRFQREFNIF